MSDTALELIQRAERARRENRLIDAHRGFMQAVALCPQTGARRELVRALKGLGQSERDLGRGDAARPPYEEAVAICRGENDAVQLAHTVRHLGDLHQDAGRVDLAELCYREALELYRSDKQTAPLDLANTIRPLAILRERGGDVEEAIRLWKEARDLYALVDVGEGVAESSAHLARLNG